MAEPSTVTEVEPGPAPTRLPNDMRALAADLAARGSRHMGVLVGLAVAVALLLGLLLWMSDTPYKTLYTGLADREMSEIVTALEQAGVPYELAEHTGGIRVPEDRLYDTRLTLAAAGLPRGGGGGLEFLDEPPHFGTSQFAETARYVHALETELARSIASLGGVEQARVHLALPKDTVFLRERQPPTASVVVYLFPGRVLAEGQVTAVGHLVASSVPGLSPDRVSIIDQHGHLLSRRPTVEGASHSLEQIDYIARLEARYRQRIEELLTPMVGFGRVQAQVVADVDFTVREETREEFVPNPDAKRSAQLLEERGRGLADAAAGVPGAVSNEPPGPTSVRAEPPEGGTGAGGPTGGGTRIKQSFNYELNKTVSHERVAPGAIRRLSVAVLLDDRPVDGKSDAEAKPSGQAELDRLTGLIKDAVGFDAARGDSVSVVNTRFAAPPAPPSEPWWQTAGTQTLMKFLIVGVLVVIVLLAVVRPLIQSRTDAVERLPPSPMAARSLPAPEGTLGQEGHTLEGGIVAPGLGYEPMAATGARAAPELEPMVDFQAQVSKAQRVAAEDPKRAARILKSWMVSDA